MGTSTDDENGKLDRSFVRTSPYKKAEDLRYMTFVFMTLGAVGLLAQDLLVNAPWRGNLKALPWSLVSNGSSSIWLWIFWTAVAVPAAGSFVYVLERLLSLGAEAEVDDAMTALRRIRNVRNKVKLT